MTPEVEARLQAATLELSEALSEAGEEGLPFLLEALARAAAEQGEELPPIVGMLLGT